jgi:hypothetical protein
MRLLPTPRFSFAPIVRLCGFPDRVEHETSMPIRLRAGDKLLILRRLDREGKWKSLDDKRHCLRCGSTFSGRQVDVVGGTRALGPLRLLCPSDDCYASQNDWVVPGSKQRVVPSASPAVSPFPQMPVAGEPLPASIVRVGRRRRGRANLLRAGQLPIPADQSDEPGAIGKIARFFKPARARASA